MSETDVWSVEPLSVDSAGFQELQEPALCAGAQRGWAHTALSCELL